MTLSVFTIFRCRKCCYSLLKIVVCFQTQCAICFRFCLISNLNNANRVKKVRLEFKTKQIWKKVRLELGPKLFHTNHPVKESAPVVQTLHRWFSNSRWHTFLTRITSLRSEIQAQFVLQLCTSSSLSIKEFWFCVTNGTPRPNHEKFFYTKANAMVFNKSEPKWLFLNMLETDGIAMLYGIA